MDEGLSFDDVLLIPLHSEIIPDEAITRTILARDIELSIPLISAAMDTVTEAELAIALAREGGAGVIHRNMTSEEEAEQVKRVKKSESGMITDPATISPETLIKEVLDLMKKYKISGLPVTSGAKLVGIITNRDLSFETELNREVKEVMTKDNLITAPVGTTLDDAKLILKKHKIEKLPIVDKDFNLKGLITIKDIRKKEKYPFASKDSQGRLRVGAAIGVGKDFEERVELILKAGADFIVIDVSHGDSKKVIETIKYIKKNFNNPVIIGGNVATAEGAENLIKAGADAIKVGVGPGSICTTRVVSGVGVPQLSAIMEVSKICSKNGVPLIADGGVRFSGDIVKALAAGADSVMIGNLFAGTTESPGEEVLFAGRQYKSYRGMGSLAAMKKGSADRYLQEVGVETVKLVPEGVEGLVPFKGPLSSVVYQLIGGLKSGMGYLGAETIKELHKKAKFIKISEAGVSESHVHDIVVQKEPPNYSLGD